MQHTFLSLTTLEADIRRALQATENADNDKSAAEAFNHLKTKIENYFNTAKNTESEKWKFRNAAASQAATIAEYQDEMFNGNKVGESAPSESHFHFQQSEVLALDTAPQCLFVRLSFGMLNILQIALLDVKAKQVFLVGGIIRNLEPADVRTLLYHTKLFQSAAAARTAADTNTHK